MSIAGQSINFYTQDQLTNISFNFKFDNARLKKKKIPVQNFHFSKDLN